MSIVVLSPYGSLSQESGVMYLLANYLRNFSGDVRQLTCNGLFSICDRDAVTSWKRGFHHCLECRNEQASLAEWAGIEEYVLSEYLESSVISETKRWVLTHSSEDLIGATWDGVDVLDLVSGSLKLRFGVSRPDITNKRHDFVFRRFVLSAIRMFVAAQAFLKKTQPPMAFIADGSDFITRSFVRAMERTSGEPVRFVWDTGSRFVRIYKGDNLDYKSCELLLDSISTMRSDVNTWPPELIALLDDILEYLGLSQSQLQLPIAQ